MKESSACVLMLFTLGEMFIINQDTRFFQREKTEVCVICIVRFPIE